MVGGTAAQVRRDIMAIGYTGMPTRGYSASGLVDAITRFLDAPSPQAVAIAGVGNLGRAILAYFVGRHPQLTLVAAFDVDAAKVGRVIQGCRCYPIDEVEERVREHDIRVAILTVPAGAAQGVADAFVRAGVTGLVNFAPVPLRVPAHVYVEHIDMTRSLEKVAYFARQLAVRKDGSR